MTLHNAELHITHPFAFERRQRPSNDSARDGADRRKNGTAIQPAKKAQRRFLARPLPCNRHRNRRASVAVFGIHRLKYGSCRRGRPSMAKGRRVQSGEGAFELRETQFAYNAIFDNENRDIDPK